MKSLIRSEWTLLAFIMVYSFIPAVGGLIRVLEQAGGPAIAPENPRALSDPFPITLHILTSFLFVSSERSSSYRASDAIIPQHTSQLDALS